jgi:hydrogenase maturation protease
MKNSVVLAIGNTLLSDEGAGIHVLNYLIPQTLKWSGVRFIDGGTLSFTLAVEIEDADNLIVLDAAKMGAEPGTVRCFADADFDNFIGQPRLSSHEVGLADLVDIARLTESLPSKRALVGIEPQTMDWGEQPSPAVCSAIPDAAQVVVDLLQTWGAIPASVTPVKTGVMA